MSEGSTRIRGEGPGQTRISLSSMVTVFHKQLVHTWCALVKWRFEGETGPAHEKITWGGQGQRGQRRRLGVMRKFGVSAGVGVEDGHGHGSQNDRGSTAPRLHVGKGPLNPHSCFMMQCLRFRIDQ
jgi:hypothetical protein